MAHLQHWGVRWFFFAVVAWLGGSAGAIAQDEASPSDDIRRGEYLAKHVAMCVQCHSPRDSSSELIEREAFQGGRIPITRPSRQTEWAVRAPRLAGLPGWSDEAFLTLLTKGRRQDGQAPRLPMPPFRLQAEDAAAIAAYLRSIE